MNAHKILEELGFTYDEPTDARHTHYIKGDMVASIQEWDDYFNLYVEINEDRYGLEYTEMRCTDTIDRARLEQFIKLVEEWKWNI